MKNKKNTFNQHGMLITKAKNANVYSEIEFSYIDVKHFNLIFNRDLRNKYIGVTDIDRTLPLFFT